MESLSLLLEVVCLFGLLGPHLVVVALQEVLAVRVHQTQSDMLLCDASDVLVLPRVDRHQVLVYVVEAQRLHLPLH